MTERNVSYVGISGQTHWQKGPSIIPSKWRNYALVIWSLTDDLMLTLELEESWSDQNYLRFKRITNHQTVLSELTRRKMGVTSWPDESIVVEGALGGKFRLADALRK